MTQVLDTDKRGLVFKIVNSKIAEENVDKKHVVYSVEIRYISGTDDFSPCVIERRYTDFANLYNSIRKEHPAMTSTLTFPKKVLTGNFEMDLIGSRSSSFEALLKHICSESQLRLSPAFAHFLQEPELTHIKSLLLEKEYEFAYPLLEQSFKLLDKVYTNRSPVVLLALCRLLACSVLLPGMPGASKWSDLTLSRFDGVRKYEYTYDREQYITREPRNKRPKCGISFSKPQLLRIIGGVESQKYKWPWHVAVLNQYKEVFCGGTLIAARWVLTASHCIRKYLRVRLNAFDLRSHDGSDIEMIVYKMFTHPKFDYKTVDNDIALLMLPRNVRAPIACLPNRKPKAGQLCSVMGWGKVHTGDTYGVSLLHEAKLPVVSHRTCKRSYREFLISSNMLCAGWKSGKSDTCAGDSGGGLMCPNRKSKKQIYSVQGITSFGDGCGERNKFGIYTAVFNYVNWINYVIEHYSYDSDLLELYIPILQTCLKVYWKDGRDRSDLEKRLNDFKKQGIKIHEHVNLLDSIQAVEKKIFL